MVKYVGGEGTIKIGFFTGMSSKSILDIRDVIFYTEAPEKYRVRFVRSPGSVSRLSI